VTRCPIPPLCAAALLIAAAAACTTSTPPLERRAEAAAATAGSREALRVCSDPNNLPFSNDRGEGFENAIAEILARELGRRLEYTWWPQRRGFIRNTLQAGECDVVIGVPAGYEMTRTTRPYYRSTYVFVTRRGGPVQVRSLDDEVLRRTRIGLHVIGDDYANVPPAQALARRGIVGNIRGYSIYGDYSKPNPPAALIAAVAAGEVDVAIAWGPLAGYFASREPVPLSVTHIAPEREGPIPFAYDISMGVRRDDESLERQLDTIITDRASDIESVLRRFGVPMVSHAEPGPAVD
jgi:mxaJ protein